MPGRWIKKRRTVSRRVGVGIIVLSVLSAVLLTTIVWLFLGLEERQGRVALSVREDAIWAAFQADREAANLVAAVLDQGGPDHDAVSLHFDLLYSRIGLLGNGKYAITFAGADGIADKARAVTDAVLALTPTMDAALADPTILVDRREQILASARAIQRSTGDLLVSANAAINALRVNERHEALATYWQIGTAVAALTLLCVLIVSLLAVQLKHISRTGREIELLSQRNARVAKQAQAASRAKSTFLATMSHEIRTPLNGIIGMADILESTALSAEQRADLKVIRQSGDILLDVINDILDFSKLEAGAMTVEKRLFALPEMMESIQAIMEPRARNAGLHITFDYAQVTLSTDASRLRQVLINFIGNAIKFTPGGSVNVHAELQGDRLVCSVRDTGPGISEGDMSRLFREFDQLDGSATRTHGGTGLGLAISKRLAEALGGSVGVNSEPGLGSTFWVDVPVTDVGPILQAVASPAAMSPAHVRNGEVLVVDDNDVNRAVAGGLLERMGYRVSFAQNGEEACNAVSEKDFALVLMDMQMPVLDGIESTKRIRAQGNATPIVGLSANAFDSDRHACLAAGMNDFIAKPVTREKLAGLFRAEAPSAARDPVQMALEVNLDYQAALAEELGHDVFEGLVERFRSDAGALLDEAEAAVTSKDDAALDRALHTLKGAAATLGFTQLSNRADKMRHGVFEDAPLRSLIP